jgi:hypothetical protein
MEYSRAFSFKVEFALLLDSSSPNILKYSYFLFTEILKFSDEVISYIEESADCLTLAE